MWIDKSAESIQLVHYTDGAQYPAPPPGIPQPIRPLPLTPKGSPSAAVPPKAQCDPCLTECARRPRQVSVVGAWVRMGAHAGRE